MELTVVSTKPVPMATIIEEKALVAIVFGNLPFVSPSWLRAWTNIRTACCERDG